jgi:hypothetical protein
MSQLEFTFSPVPRLSIQQTWKARLVLSARVGKEFLIPEKGLTSQIRKGGAKVLERCAATHQVSTQLPALPPHRVRVRKLTPEECEGALCFPIGWTDV